MVGAFSRPRDAGGTYNHRVRCSLHHVIAFCLLPALIVILPGCRSNDRAREADALRRRVRVLESERDHLSRRVTELEHVLTAGAGRVHLNEAEILANTPSVAEITIGRLSHARDDDGDGRADRLIVYVSPVDSLGRFVQVTGTVSLHAGVLPADGPARTLARAAFDPGEVRGAYRSSFTGTHYTFELPINHDDGPVQDEEAAPLRDVLLRVELVDGLSGGVFTADRTVSLRPLARDARPRRQSDTDR